MEATISMMNGVMEIRGQFVQGRTVLIPDGRAGYKPDQYRPITCLNHSYKLLMAVLAVEIDIYVEGTGALPNKKKTLSRGT